MLSQTFSVPLNRCAEAFLFEKIGLFDVLSKRVDSVKIRSTGCSVGALANNSDITEAGEHLDQAA
jgi:hypothetical protein